MPTVLMVVLLVSIVCMLTPQINPFGLSIITMRLMIIMAIMVMVAIAVGCADSDLILWTRVVMGDESQCIGCQRGTVQGPTNGWCSWR